MTRTLPNCHANCSRSAAAAFVVPPAVDMAATVLTFRCLNIVFTKQLTYISSFAISLLCIHFGWQPSGVVHICAHTYFWAFSARNYLVKTETISIRGTLCCTRFERYLNFGLKYLWVESMGLAHRSRSLGIESPESWQTK